MQQYHAIKSRYPHALLLFRLGDFYELFYEARSSPRVSFKSRSLPAIAKKAAHSMCGVPYHAADGYIARLIRNGFKVAICDQMEAPGPAKSSFAASRPRYYARHGH